MRKAFWIPIVLLIILSVATGFAGYAISHPYLQSVAAGAATTLIGLALAILLVNVYLNSAEKTEAAAPLAKLIQPAIVDLHNDLYIKLWQEAFGLDKSGKLNAIYQDNNRNPKAFSPEQCVEIHDVIMGRKDELIQTYDILIDQFREISMITGWTFDPDVTGAALEARLNFVKFKTLQGAKDIEQKYQAIEAYLDGEAAASYVYEKLLTRLGLPRAAWEEMA